jgi:hypothetical protein
VLLAIFALICDGVARSAGIGDALRFEIIDNTSKGAFHTTSRWTWIDRAGYAIAEGPISEEVRARVERYEFRLEVPQRRVAGHPWHTISRNACLSPCLLCLDPHHLGL